MSLRDDFARTYRQRVELLTRKIDDLTGEADRLALRGKLTVEEKLSRLNAWRRSTSATVGDLASLAGDGLERASKELEDSWHEVQRTAQDLSDELRRAKEDRGKETKEARGSGREAESALR